MFYILVGFSLAGYAFTIVGFYVLSKEEKMISQGLKLENKSGFSFWRISAIIYALLWILTVGTLSCYLWMDVDFVTALYFTVVTCTTVGYGDITPEGTAQKLYFAFYILCSTSTTAACLITVAQMFFEHHRTKLTKKILNTKLTPDKLKLMDANHNGTVSEQEYVEAMLVILGKVEPKDIEELKNSI